MRQSATLRLLGRSLLLFCLVNLTFAASAFGAETTLIPADFMGPAPGTVYHYSFQFTPATMTLTGVCKDAKGGCLIKEEMITAIPDIGVRKDVREYIQYTDGSRVMEAPLSSGGSIPPLISLDTGRKQWGNPATRMDTGKRIVTDCTIVSIEKYELFGEIRTVLTVGGEYCMPRKYASGIGLIQEADMHLIRIECTANTPRTGETKGIER